MSLLNEPSGLHSGRSLGPQELAPIAKMQRTLTLATGLSLAFVDVDGGLINSSPHPEDPLHSLLMNHRGFVRGLLAGYTDREAFRMHGESGGLCLMFHEVRVPRELIGYVVAGPWWEVPPGAEEAACLAELLGTAEEQVRAAMGRGPVRPPLDVARELMASLADVTAHSFLEHRQQRRSLDTLAALYEIGRALSASLELDDVLETVLSRSVELLGASSGSLILLNEARGELHILSRESPEQSVTCLTRIGLGEDVASWVAKEGGPMPVPGPALTVALKVQDRCLGVIKLGSRIDGAPYTDHDLQVLCILGGHAASAIDNAQLYSRVRRQVRELEALHGVAQAVNSSLHVQDTLQQVLDSACELLGARAASVMLLEPDGMHLTIRQAHGLTDDVVQNTRVRIGERISGKVAHDGQPTALPRGRDAHGEELEAALCVPLKMDNKVVGVLNVRARDDFNEFSREDIEFATRLASISAAALENAELHDELQLLLMESITAMANAIDARDEYTRGHSERVTEYTVMLAQKLGMEEHEIERVRYAALLHDIGKIRIPDLILNKPGSLTDDEVVEMRRHTLYGADIIEPVRAFHPLIPFLVHHHERYDGRGYPDGIGGEDIPLAARLICVADCFDAMTTDRPYRKGMSLEASIDELLRNSGGQFDPKVVNAFLELLEEGRIQAVLESMPGQCVPPPRQENGNGSQRKVGGRLVGRRS